MSVVTLIASTTVSIVSIFVFIVETFVSTELTKIFTIEFPDPDGTVNCSIITDEELSALTNKLFPDPTTESVDK